jgi:hypothetical protein
MAKRRRSRAKKNRKKPRAPKRKPAGAKKKLKRAKKPARALKPARRKKSRRPRGRAGNAVELNLPRRAGLGPGAGGQSGDLEGLSGGADADSESVAELSEEGQGFEAEIVDAIEGAPDPDQGEVKTREIPEDDIPEEYDDDEKPGRFSR